MKIVFARIDARGACDVIAIDKPYYGIARSKHNVLVMTKAIKTYLGKLYKLQQSIINEFEPQLEDDSDIPEDESFYISEEYNNYLREHNKYLREKEKEDRFYNYLREKEKEDRFYNLYYT